MFHVIDDTEFFCELVKMIVEDHGYRAKSFECSEAYIEFVNSAAFASPIAVFTDVNMPGMNGYEMMSVVSRLKSGLKFVVMTTEANIRTGYMDNPCIHLSKPFTAGNLVKVIESLIQSHNCSSANDYERNSVDDLTTFLMAKPSCS